MSDKDNTNDKPKTSGTLSLGGTLSVGGGQSRPKSGIAVEVRRRRFNTPAEGSDAAAQIDTSEDSELARRAQALEEAKKNAAEEEKRREEERKQAEQLSQMKADQAEEAKRREEEEAKRLEAAVTQVYADGTVLPPDQGGTASTTVFCTEVRKVLFG